MPSLPSVLTAVFGLLLACVTVVGIITATNDHSQRPGHSQSNSEIVLYGRR